jgi:hypothetical protein
MLAARRTLVSADCAVALPGGGRSRLHARCSRRPHARAGERLWQLPAALVPAHPLAARRAGEKLWRLPIEEEYADQIKSSSADLKNYGGRPGGAITAALFLQVGTPRAAAAEAGGGAAA